MRKIHFHAADTEAAQDALARLKKQYGQAAVAKCDVIVTLGGDGTMLEALHKFHVLDVPIYGMNRGSVGFLTNPYRREKLPQLIASARKVVLHPLRMKARARGRKTIKAIAFNEVSLFRQERHGAKISISINGVERLKELMCDGVLLSTPAGSTAYNLSAHGPIIPLSANVLAMTPISAFRPRRWRGALVAHDSHVDFTVQEHIKRPVSATADYTEVRDVTHVAVGEDRGISVTLLFDPAHSLDERIQKEQFLP